MIAIAISLAWHLFWMFGVRVAVAPRDAWAVKFSKVAFLGPILERGALEVRLARGERTFLEKRYLEIARGMAAVTEEAPAMPSLPDLAESDIYAAVDAELLPLMKEAVSSSKLEPAYGAE